ncbi:hypothetical protein FQA47_000673 [Oryzias melastigma]|uniref:Uncharacterized protein n=1 Tax=Oryzias melastigma TaxID=30732 RepID=A0A834BSP4_ORYME|nr:hypothetical protein FQA47_000673 [Oryzias melastigma]
MICKPPARRNDFTVSSRRVVLVCITMFQPGFYSALCRAAPCLPLTVRHDTPTDMIASKHQPPHNRRHTTHTTSKDSVSLLSLIVSQSVSDKQTQPIASFSLTAMMDHLSTTTSNQG